LGKKNLLHATPPPPFSENNHNHHVETPFNLLFDPV
jgi:hypothetical protein